MKALTPQDVVDLHRHLCGTYDATLVDRSSKAALEAFQRWLVAHGVEALRAYQGQYATTLGTTIYLPYEPGVPTEAWFLAYQCATIAHECHHVVQFRAAPLTFTTSYLADSESRAAYEAECYRCTCEVMYFLTGMVIAPSFADCLQAYLCSPDDVAMARQMLADADVTIAAGGLITESAKETVRFLRARGYGP